MYRCGISQQYQTLSVLQEKRPESSAKIPGAEHGIAGEPEVLERRSGCLRGLGGTTVRLSPVIDEVTLLIK
jgi:hypothetical protein